MIELSQDGGFEQLMWECARFPKLGPFLVGATLDEVPTSMLTELSPAHGSSG